MCKKVLLCLFLSSPFHEFVISPRPWLPARRLRTSSAPPRRLCPPSAKKKETGFSSCHLGSVFEPHPPPRSTSTCWSVGPIYRQSTLGTGPCRHWALVPTNGSQQRPMCHYRESCEAHARPPVTLLIANAVANATHDAIPNTNNPADLAIPFHIHQGMRLHDIWEVGGDTFPRWPPKKLHEPVYIVYLIELVEFLGS